MTCGSKREEWRVVFRWTDAGPEDVEIIDYH
jgi:proteic killer suppression protein